jgi:hypothetical protein
MRHLPSRPAQVVTSQKPRLATHLFFGASVSESDKWIGRIELGDLLIQFRLGTAFRHERS